MDEAVRVCWRRALLPLRRTEAQRQTSRDLPNAKLRPPTRMTAPGSSEDTVGKLQTSMHSLASAVCSTIEGDIFGVKATTEDVVRIVVSAVSGHPVFFCKYSQFPVSMKH